LGNGEKIYNQECAACHGTTGLGDGPQAGQLSVPAATLGLSDFARMYSPADWYTIVTQGNTDQFMPAFTNLTDRQRWDVVAYAMSLSVSDELVAQGKVLYQEYCTACHGQAGEGNGPDAATLSSKPARLMDQSLIAQSSSDNLYQAITSGILPDMPAFTSTLEENERWALVGYLRSLTYAVPETSQDPYPSPEVASLAPTSEDTYPAPQAYPYPAVTANPILAPTVEITSSATFTGSVAVKLINGSGGEFLPNVSVILYAFDDMQNTYSETLTTGVDGVFTFTNVRMPEGRVFLARADYASGIYGSDIVTVDPATPDLNLQVTVYDSTTDTSGLTTDRIHIFFDFTDPENVQVIEVFIISNASKQAVVAPTQDGPVVTFPLPQGYTNLQFQEGALGDRYMEVPEGFADTLTVNPGVGDYQVIFAFQMPYDRKLEFAQPMFLPTSALVIMVPENGVKVVSSQLQDAGLRDFQGSSYHMYNGSSLIAGSAPSSPCQEIRKAATSLINTSSTQNLAIGLKRSGVALIVFGLWLFRRNRRKAVCSPPEGVDLQLPASNLVDMPEDEDTLMDAIIALDDQYHSGNLPEEAYMERRAVLKDKLRNFEQG
jgi:mono/diheme cytochrome c family protein